MARVGPWVINELRSNRRKAGVMTMKILFMLINIFV